MDAFRLALPPAALPGRGCGWSLALRLSPARSVGIKAQRALEQIRRHMPEELFQQMLRQQPELAAYEELGIAPDELGILPD